MKTAWGVVGAVVLAAVGCGGNDQGLTLGPIVEVKQVTVPSPPPPPVCEAGRVVSCPCAGGAEGTQVCAADGSAWGACDGCGGAGGGGGAGGEGGAPCVPKADPCAGLECGLGDDGCGVQVECPSHCADGDICTSGACCHPTVTSCAGRCGPQADGCGTMYCDDVCGDGVWLTCDAAAGRCACQDAAVYPNFAQAVQFCGNGGEVKKPVVCPDSGDSYADIPPGCKYASGSGNWQPGALLYCCDP